MTMMGWKNVIRMQYAIILIIILVINTKSVTIPCHHDNDGKMLFECNHANNNSCYTTGN
ncbi:MAG: hypothetical protein ACI8RD_010225 [Bacillariaceae sp.]|jgi:hypothetical protein